MIVFEYRHRSVTLSAISLRWLNRISILLPQNDRLILSFRLRGLSTSSLFKNSLSLIQNVFDVHFYKKEHRFRSSVEDLFKAGGRGGVINGPN